MFKYISNNFLKLKIHHKVLNTRLQNDMQSVNSVFKPAKYFSIIHNKKNSFTTNNSSSAFNQPIDIESHIEPHVTVSESKSTKLHIEKKIKIPFYCSIFQLAEILKIDMIELIEKFRDVVQIEINDPLEFLFQDDLHLFLMENDIDFEVIPHESITIRRPMIVTIMGHVDHGKTTLLDTFRNSKLVDKEFGRITQTIGAFNITLADGTELTFIDTPGHEAFVKMRQRGAKITDVVVLVISGIESVQKQTIEVLNIVKAAKVNFIIAVNKIDKDQADPQRVYLDLLEHGVMVKSMGGNVPNVEISAKNRINIDKLEIELSHISNKLNLEEETNIPAQAFIIESKTNRIQSYVNSSATAIVKKGILKEGDVFICGEDSFGKVKHMSDDLGVNSNHVHPGKAVEIVGFKKPPQTGAILAVMENIIMVEKLIESRKKLKEYNDSKQKEEINKGFKLGKLKRKERKFLMKGGGRSNLDFLKQKIEGAIAINPNHHNPQMIKEIYLNEDVQKKKIILRADTIGMLETIEDEILKNYDENKLNEYIIQTGVGAISEDEFKLAKTANAVFFTFNLEQEIEGFSEIYKVGVRKHKLIYNIIEEIKHFIKEADLSDPVFHMETNDYFKGRAIVKEVFKIKFNNKPANIAGVEVELGAVNSHSKYRIIRENKIVKIDVKISSLKQNKQNVSIVRENEECGIILENFDEIKEGDILDCYDTNPKFDGITNTKSVVECYTIN